MRVGSARTAAFATAVFVGVAASHGGFGSHQDSTPKAASVSLPAGIAGGPSAALLTAAGGGKGVAVNHRRLEKLPASTSFFPIAVWDQSPQGGNVPAPYANQAAAFKAMGINVFLGLYGWPENYGSDNGEIEAAAAEGMYVVAGGDPYSDTSPQSVASVEALVATLPASEQQYFAGYQWLDEPAACNGSGETQSIAAQIATVNSEDPGKIISANEGSWAAFLPNNLMGSSTCLTQAEANLKDASMLSADDYALTDPWHSSQCIGANCIYLYGQEAANLKHFAKPTQPVWEFVETGTDDLGYSSQNGACDAATNLCANGNEYRATPVQVNSSAWDAVINGARGIEWFCDDTIAYDACAGGGSDGNPAEGGSTVIPANLTYIDQNIEGFASELNSPDVGGLTVSSSNSSVPVTSMLKKVDGQYYLFTESNRDGATTATYADPAFANKTATLVYDSAANYDPASSEQGNSFTVSADGSFTDTLGTSANPYQVKVYEIGNAGGSKLAGPNAAQCTHQWTSAFTLTCKQ